MTTTNLVMTLPTVGASSDTWGDTLNADLNLIDAAVVPTRYTNFTNTSSYANASATAKMCGFGSSWTITRSASTVKRVRVKVSGRLLINGSGTGFVHVKYGTGTAPIQGAATTGTAGLGAEMYYSGAVAEVPFTYAFDATGLTASTAYWFDISLRSDGSVTATVTPLSIIIEEIF